MLCTTLGRMVYDAIVVGLGGVGSAALYHLANRGAKVLGLEQFDLAHDRGSSHGATRVIRQAYFEHPDYVPLVQRAYELWRALENGSAQALLNICGVLEIGPADGVVVPGVKRSAAEHGLALETLDAKQVAQRFPGFTLPDGLSAVFESTGGYLLVEDCVRAHVAQAVELGAQAHFSTAVLEWQREGDGWRVITPHESYLTQHVVVAGGAWSSKLVPDGPKLEIVRKHVHWFPAESHYHVDEGSPAFLYEVDNDIFYGLPAIDRLGVKIGRHSGGVVLDDPLQCGDDDDADDWDSTVAFRNRCLPGLSSERSHHETCLYTRSVDEHFVLDAVPAQNNVWFCSGLSGHGFKFASVLGEILAQLALDGHSHHPWQFLSLARFND